MHTLPLFHLNGENTIMKNILDDNGQEIFLVNPESLEIFYMNKKAFDQHGYPGKPFPVSVSRLGPDYNLRSFKGLISPLLNGSRKDIMLLTSQTSRSGKSYPVEAKITVATTQGLQYLVMTVRDISQIKKLEKEISRKKSELEKLESELDRFVHSASNDLLAPVGTLKGLLSLVEKENSFQLNPAYAEMMLKTVIKLERYVYDMIDFSTNMKRVVQGGDVNFKSLVALSLDNLRFMEGFMKMSIHVEVSQEVDFSSDESRLQILLNNLLSNAIKYQDPLSASPFMNIQVIADQHKAVIRITDNGTGISKESIDRVFDMFYRASALSFGSGLGLYLVKEVVRKLRGSIQVASTLGKGTEFLLEIPNKYKGGSVQKRVNVVKPDKTAL